jgi:hypothetical protein
VLRIRTASGGVLILGLLACVGAPDEGASLAPRCRIGQRPIPLPPELQETSGAAVSRSHRGVIWTHNDSGAEAELFAVDAGGRILARVAIAGVRNVDWEDLAIGPCADGECLYIADIGDNDSIRRGIVVHRIAEPPVRSGRVAVVESFPMRYPDGPRDAEALFVLPPDRIYVVTKGGEHPVILYRYPGELRHGQMVELERVRVLAPGPTHPFDQVTGADATRDGERVLIRTYASLLVYETGDLLGSEEPRPVNISLDPLSEPQGEGVAVGENGVVVLTSEGKSDALPPTLTILRCELAQAR